MNLYAALAAALLFLGALTGAYWKGGSDREAHMIADQAEAIANQQALAAQEAAKHEQERERLRKETKRLQRKLAELGSVGCRIGPDRLRLLNDALNGATSKPDGAVPPAPADPD